MTLWRIDNGIPSLADALLVSVCPMAVCLSIIPISDWLLSYLEPHDLGALGFFLALMFMLGIGALTFSVFRRNERRIRPEIIIPRRVFAITSVPLIFIAYQMTLPWAFRTAICFYDHHLLLSLFFTGIFGLVVRGCLKFPHRASEVAIWFSLILSAIGLVAKAALIFVKK